MTEEELKKIKEILEQFQELLEQFLLYKKYVEEKINEKLIDEIEKIELLLDNIEKQLPKRVGD